MGPLLGYRFTPKCANLSQFTVTLKVQNKQTANKLIGEGELNLDFENCEESGLNLKIEKLHAMKNTQKERTKFFSPQTSLKQVTAW